MNKAIFLDRDGVINKMIYNDSRNEFEPPFSAQDLKLYEGVTEVLKKFSDKNYKLFLVSNQPDFAKGKTKLENLVNVHNELHRIFTDREVFFAEYFYCYHHPNGIVKEYTFDCDCRKPKPYFVFMAIKDHKIDPANSWFIGDRDTDVECGKSAGLKTILIENPDSKDYRGKSFPDHTAVNLSGASEIIFNTELNQIINQK